MSDRQAIVKQRRLRRTRFHLRRKAADGTLRLSVHRSSKHVYAQIIDDIAGKTLVAASTLDKQLQGKLKTGATVEAAKHVGLLLGQRAKAKGLKGVYFDRGHYLYHGRVKAVAEGAREGGLEF